MKFYDRKNELKLLAEGRRVSIKNGTFTVMVGRRRIGKTSLLLESVKKKKHLYLFVSRQSEVLLCEGFQDAAFEKLGLRIFGRVSRFRDLFEQLLLFGKEQPYTLIIDEFQDLERVNPAIFGEIQNLWDQYKDRVKINFIASGSVYSMMIKIFENNKEPLFGRLTSRFLLKPFKVDVIKEILADHNPAYTAEDILCLYLITGGVPKYISLLMDAGAVDIDKMLGMLTRQDSPFLGEGKDILVSEFGKEYGIYFSVLQLIARGKTTQIEIDSIIGKNTGAYLSNLEKEYSLIERYKPMFSKPESRNTRWRIGDNFLRFWFRFIFPNQYLVETGQFDALRKLIERDYIQYSGLVLEQYFRDKLAGSGEAAVMGSWWDSKGENEIDLIVLNKLDRTATVAEVKRSAEKISLPLLEEKAKKLRRELSDYRVQYRGLSMADM
ncbi:MAG: ATP-binding protein [Treponema sp.]|jgi:AAA+ ATPase superfamily predicted ATPase|nr:ATP-binding protein [Treponema sp.]